MDWWRTHRGCCDPTGGQAQRAEYLPADLPADPGVDRAEAGWTATAIAQALNEAGYCPAHTTTRFGAQTIRRLQQQLELKAPRPRVRQRDELGPDEWWPAELVRVLEIPRASLYHWIHQGLVRAHQLDEPLHRWVVWADEAEQKRLRQYHKRAIGDDLRHRWTGVSLAEEL